MEQCSGEAFELFAMCNLGLTGRLLEPGIWSGSGFVVLLNEGLCCEADPNYEVSMTGIKLDWTHHNCHAAPLLG